MLLGQNVIILKQTLVWTTPRYSRLIRADQFIMIRSYQNIARCSFLGNTITQIRCDGPYVKGMSVKVIQNLFSASEV